MNTQEKILVYNSRSTETLLQNHVGRQMSRDGGGGWAWLFWSYYIRDDIVSSLWSGNDSEEMTTVVDDGLMV